MRKHIYRIISVLVVVITVLLAITGAGKVLKRKDADERCAEFFTDTSDYDVLFLGTSHMINGVYPMELWEDYGITSFNLAGHGMNISTTYWVMMNAFDYHVPKVVVIDCMLINGYGKLNPALSHLELDAFPFSKTKVEMMQDLATDFSEQMEYLFDFSIYHARWNELTAEDFNPSYKVEKGAETRNFVADVNSFSWSVGDRKFETETTLGIEYLEKMIEECQNRGIDVLLTYLPFPASEDEQLEANRVPDIAKKYGVDYINFLKMEGLIDYATDCSDEASHLNGSGARKVTNYLGNYLAENYGIESHKENAALCELWDSDYEKYKKFKKNNFAAQDDLNAYLSMLADNSYDCVLDINVDAITDKQARLLNNLGIDVQDESHKSIYYVDYSSMDLDRKNFKVTGDLNGTELSFLSNVISETTTEDKGISIIVLESDSHEIVDKSMFLNDENSFNRVYS